MNKFYVYALLDTSKPGIYHFDDLTFEYEPFYIGKGTNNRNYHSQFDKYNSFKKNKIESLKKKNIQVLSIKVFENLNEKDSFDLEVTLIKKIGRRDLELGPLTNLTDGGDGRTNIFVSQETKKKISRTKKLQNLHFKHTETTKIFLKKINQGENNPFWGKSHTEEVREIHSLRVSGTNHPMFGKKHDKETIKKIKINRSKGITQEKLNLISKELNSKPVLQFSLEGEFIKEFDSIKLAAVETLCSESIIGKCCRGITKKPRKFIFKFREEKSHILNNSYKIKINDFFRIGDLEYQLIKRNKVSCVVENCNVIYNFRKKDHSFLFEKVIT
jgi:group I intron endonuclease